MIQFNSQIDPKGKEKPVVVELQSLVLHHVGKITEEYKPRLLLHKDSLEVSWEVNGQIRSISMPRSDITYERERFEQPFLVRLGIETDSILIRHFLQPRGVSWTYRTRPTIVAEAKFTIRKTAAWSDWLRSMKAHVKKDAIPEGELNKILNYCSSGRCFTLAELSRPIVSFTPSGAAPHASPHLRDEDHPERLSPGHRLPSYDTAVSETPSVQPAQGGTIREVDCTIHQDTAELLQAWQKISDRIQLKLATLSQQEKDVDTKERMLKHQQDEIAAKETTLSINKKNFERHQEMIAAKEKSLVERETALKKVVADLQKVASNGLGDL